MSADQCIFRPSEIRAIYTWFSPAYILEAAREHGLGDAVVGAESAFADACTMTHDFVRYVVARTKRRGPRKGQTEAELREQIRDDVRFIQWVMQLGRRVPRLEPVPDPRGYRALMVRAHVSHRAWEIQGFTRPIPLPHDTTREELRNATLTAMLAFFGVYPGWNRALLPPFERPRVWRRLSAEVTMPVQFGGDDLGMVVLNAETAVSRQVRRRLAELTRVRRHWLFPLGQRLMADWLEQGFIASYSGALVSDASGLPHGRALPIFIPGTGVPISVAINPIEREQRSAAFRQPPGPIPHVVFGIGVDHRVYDAAEGAHLHHWLRTQVPAGIEEARARESRAT